MTLVWRACRAWYRLLLLAYPRRFRDAHGAEAASVFAAACQASWHRRAPREFLWRVTKAPLDVLRHGAAERIAARHVASGRRTPPSDVLLDVFREMHMPRLMRGHRAYALLAVAALSLAVGATVAVFTVVNALWLKASPVEAPDKVVMFVGNASGERDARVYSLDAFYSADRWPMFAAVAGQVATSGDSEGQAVRLVFDAIGRDAETLGVTAGYFDLLGQRIRGRSFTREDSRPGAESVAILSDRFWAQAYDRSPDVIGSVVQARPVPIRIVGVAPPGFEGARRGERVDAWVPAGQAIQRSPAGPAPTAHGLLLARLHPGQTPEAARQALDEQTLASMTLSPSELERFRESLQATRLVPLSEVYGTPSSRTIAISEGRTAAVVVGLAALVLLGSCATLMALVLMHYERRRRELSVRLALGASRPRLAAQLGVEFGWLAGAGTVGAVIVALAGLRVLPALSLPGGVDLGRLDLSIDWRVLATAISATTLTLAAAAALPVVRFTRGDLAGEIVAVRSTTPASSQRLRQTLLALHVSATIVVLVAAGLFVRAVVVGFGGGPGFDVDRIVSVRVLLPGFQARPGADIPAQLAALGERMRELADSFRELPGVDAVSIGGIPIGLDQLNQALATSPVTVGDREHRLAVGQLRGGPELIETLGVPVLSGRALAPDDASGRGAVTPVLVTASLARTLWPDVDPLGQVAQIPAGRLEVVGVVQDFAFGSMTHSVAGVFVRVFESRGIIQSWVVRSHSPSESARAIRQVIARMAPDAQRVTIATGREIIARDLGAQRLGAWFFSGFGLIALLLGAGGVFGLVAYLAESRRREFGVRVALGATPRDLVRRGLAAGLVPVGIGAAVGLVAAAMIARVFGAALPGLSPLDPLTFAGVALLMAGCAAAAGITAAWRLRGLAPVEALRAE